MRDDRQRLLDILEAITNIRKYSSEGQQRFLQDELVQVWVVHHMQIIGEAAARISPQLSERFPSVPWADIVAMRNILVHQYFGIDLAEVWSTIEGDIPQLEASLRSMLEAMDS